MRVGVIGLGTVGSTMADLFRSHGTVIGYDAASGEPYPEGELRSCNFAVVCVDTPSAPDGSCDTRNVVNAVTRLPVQQILLRSTVAPGTTDMLEASTGKQICFCPEYLGETAYLHLYWQSERDVPFVILGGRADVRQAFIDSLVPILGPDKTYLQCSALEAEMCKYMENAFLALKVTFVNEFYEICRAMGADWHTVREAWLLDPRIGRSHSAVFSGDRGFGGRCLPKDLQAIIHAAEEHGYPPRLLLEVLASNQRFRRSGDRIDAEAASG